MRRFLSRLALFALPLIACSSDGIMAPPLGFTHSVAYRSCGAADGPAIAILLGPASVSVIQPKPPFLYVAVWQSVESIVGTWSVSQSAGQGAATYRLSLDTYEGATLGTVTVTSVEADSSIVGHVDLTFPSAGRVQGGFRATWHVSDMLCG